MFKYLFVFSFVLALNSGTAAGQVLSFGPPDSGKIIRTGNFNVDIFYSPFLLEDKQGTAIPVSDKTGGTIARLSPKDWCRLSRLGSGIIKRIDGSLITANFLYSAGNKKVDCKLFYSDGLTSNNAVFFVSKAQFGEGATGYSLVPYRTISTNDDTFPIGSVVFIPAIKGQSYVDEQDRRQVHDGYFFVADAVPASGPSFISIFTGTDSANPFPNLLTKEVQFGKNQLKAQLIFDSKILSLLRSEHNPFKKTGLDKIGYFSNIASDRLKAASNSNGISVNIMQGRARIVASSDASDLSISNRVIRVNILHADEGTRFSVSITPAGAAKMGIKMNESSSLDVYNSNGKIKWVISRGQDLSYNIRFTTDGLINNSEVVLDLFDRLAINTESGGGGGLQEYPDPYYPFESKWTTAFKGKPGLDLDKLGKLLKWDLNESPIDAIVKGKLGSRPKKELYSRLTYNNYPLLKYAINQGYCIDANSPSKNLTVLSMLNGDDFLKHGVHADFMGAGPDNCYSSWSGRLHEGADIRAFTSTPVYTIFDSESASVHDDSIGIGRYIKTKLGSYVAYNGVGYDIIVRYLHLDRCSALKSVPLASGGLLGHTAAWAYAGVAERTPAYRAIQRQRASDRYKCKIDFASHLHIDVLIEPQSNGAGNTDLTPFFIDPILFMKYVKDYNANSKKSVGGGTQVKLDTPAYLKWNFVACSKSMQTDVVLMLGRPDTCSLRIDIQKSKNGAMPAKAIFNYELIYQTQGKQVILPVPGADTWISSSTLDGVNASINEEYYRFDLPLMVNFRPSRVYSKLRVIGKITFNNGTSKTVVEDLNLAPPK